MIKAESPVIFWILCSMLIFSNSLPAANLFKCNLQNEAIYTPGKLKLALSLTENSVLKGGYSVKTQIYIGESLVRKVNIPITVNTAEYEIEIPEIKIKTSARCQVELYINNHFVEGWQTAFTLWPQSAPINKSNSNVIWVYDLSGNLQAICAKAKLETSDATFQNIRTFENPDIVILGQQLDPNSMQTIINRVSAAEGRPILILSKQLSFPDEFKAHIFEKKILAQRPCDCNSQLLTGLNEQELTYLIRNSQPVALKKVSDMKITSVITAPSEDANTVNSYLAVTKLNDLVNIFCQLPLNETDNPVQQQLLGNILRYAFELRDKQSYSAKMKGQI